MSNYYVLELNCGDTFYANTNTELLNKIFKTHYKKWSKCVWRNSPNSLVWLVRIDGITRNGFTNYWINQDIISQRYDVTDKTYERKPISVDAPNDYRLVFEVIGTPQKKYVFHGVFLMNRANSTPEHMYFQKCFETFPF